MPAFVLGPGVPPPAMLPPPELPPSALPDSGEAAYTDMASPSESPRGELRVCVGMPQCMQRSETPGGDRSSTADSVNVALSPKLHGTRVYRMVPHRFPPFQAPGGMHAWPSHEGACQVSEDMLVDIESLGEATSLLLGCFSGGTSLRTSCDGASRRFRFLHPAHDLDW